MLNRNCITNLRHDRTSHRAPITLPKRGWSIIEAKQEKLAAERNVPRVSRPVALMEILDEYERTIVTTKRLFERLGISPRELEDQASFHQFLSEDDDHTLISLGAKE